MYTVLSGAKKNIGDFLITDRCKKLLRKYKPEHELFQLPYWETLYNNIKKVNQSKAIIIMGGPGFQPNFYPGIYKLIPELDEIKPPIIPMALGWKGFPGDYCTLKHYKFSKKSMNALNRINNNRFPIGCRDYMTKEVLIRNGLNNILMIGDPVWYDLDSIGKTVIRKDNINKIVFTPAQRHIYREQSIKILKLIKSLFPNSEIFCSFHRGIKSNDKFTDKSDEQNNLIIKNFAEKLGVKVIDLSYDLDKIKFYDECDLHIGYRVHGHIYFLSKRRPSILIHEDGRGKGVSESLNIKGIDAFERTSLGNFAGRLNVKIFSKGIKKVFGVVKPNNNTIDMLKDYLIEEIDNKFARFAGVGNIIDNHLEIMEKFIKNLP